MESSTLRRGTLDRFPLERGCLDGIAIQSLEAGTVLAVRTRHSTYSLVVLEGPRRHVLLTGGALFPESTPVRVEGATAGGSMLKTGWIGVGLKLEIWAGEGPVTTSPVESVTIERHAPIH